MNAQKKFAVGQKVLVTQPYSRSGPTEATVSKVGRTLVYVGEGWSALAFHMDNGAERRSPNAGGVGAHIFTLDEWADRERRAEITKALAAHGIGSKGYGHFKQSTDVLQEILDVLDAAEFHAGGPA